MLSITGRSARRWRRGFAHPWPLFGIAALTTLGCSIYGAPDGPESLETLGSSGSVGNDGGTSSSGGSKAAGGSMAASGSAGVAEGGSGDGSGGSELSAGGTETGSGGKGPGSGGSGGSDGGSTSGSGATGGDGGSSAGTNSTGGTGGSGGASDIVELALNKPAFGSSDQVAYTFAHGNDGNATTRWCSVERTFPQHWVVDLGESHELTSFEVTWESEYREMTYEVATSEDNQTYVVQVSRAQTGRLQSGPMMPGATGRFVRVWVTNAGGSAWPSFFEFKVFGK